MDVVRLNSMVSRDDWALMLVSSSLVYGTITLKSALLERSWLCLDIRKVWQTWY
jgi:hypothetical protein